MVGLAGAALGLGPRAAQEFFEQESFEFGVHGKTQGIAKDLWKYDDFKNRSIILKEVMFANYLTLVYGCENAQKIEALSEAFRRPVYALTLGSSDSLAKVGPEILITEETQTTRDVAHCILEGDIVNELLHNASMNPEFSIYTTSEPIALDIPTHFHYESDYGVRSVIRRKILSFIGRSMKLNIDKKAVACKGKVIPVFKYQ